VQPQTYQLYIHVKNNITIEIGRLGTFDFPAGFYIYTGSAKRGMDNRLARHLSKEKKLRWHIDYLLNHPDVSISKIEKFMQPECEINSQTEGHILVPGFGAGDCGAACGSHLKAINKADQAANHIDF
jgi:Uri superfamily endonuclease